MSVWLVLSSGIVVATLASGCNKPKLSASTNKPAAIDGGIPLPLLSDRVTGSPCVAAVA